MPEHHFELTIRGELADALLDALAEGGCDDATFSSKGDLIFAAFDRETPTMVDAVISAIQSIEAVGELEVLHVDPDELVWASEIAERTGRSRSSVVGRPADQGAAWPGGFPGTGDPRHAQSSVALV